MQVTHKNPDEEIAVFEIIGALDAIHVENFSNAILPQADKFNGIILECSQMPYLTSVGLRAIMSIGKAMLAKKSKLVLCGLDGLSKQIIETSGFGKVFPLVQNIDEGRELFK